MSTPAEDAVEFAGLQNWPDGFREPNAENFADEVSRLMRIPVGVPGLDRGTCVACGAPLFQPHRDRCIVLEVRAIARRAGVRCSDRRTRGRDRRLRTRPPTT